MTSAVRSSLHVGKPKRRNSQSSPRQNVFRALAVGAATVIVGIVSIATIMTGTGWILGVSLKARSDVRSVVAHAPPPNPQVAAVLMAGELAPPLTVAANSPQPDMNAFAETPAQTPAAALALVIPNPFGKQEQRPVDVDHTGSISIERPRLESIGLASVSVSEKSSA